VFVAPFAGKKCAETEPIGIIGVKEAALFALLWWCFFLKLSLATSLQ
jgi:hypothetical protein